MKLYANKFKIVRQYSHCTYTAAGVIMNKKEGHIFFLPFKLFFYPNYMDNILSLKDVGNTLLVAMDTIKEREMCVHTGNYIVMKWRECGDRIYYSDILGHDNTTNNMVCNYSFLSTVVPKKKYLMCQESEGEDRSKL